MNNDWLQNVFDSIAERGRELPGLEDNLANKLNLHAFCQQLLMDQGEDSGIALSQEYNPRLD